MEKFDDLRITPLNEGEANSYDVPELDILKTLDFNEKTGFKDFTLPNKLLQQAKIPPLGIRELQSLGYNGEGVTVAIIDQPIGIHHPEYKGKIINYKNYCKKESGVSSMHGPAVASLLAGETCGVAPKVKIIYAAVPSWESDASYPAKALSWIIKENRKLPAKDKLKFVSVSAAFGSKKMFKKHTDNWLDMVKVAEKEGILVVEATEGNRFVSAGYIDNDTKQFKYGFPYQPMRHKQVGSVHVPLAPRTVAETYDDKNFSYAYYGAGGLSWGIPYAVGVLCLGQQANKDLSAFELKDLLLKSASENEGIVDAAGFIESVKNYSSDKEP